MRAVTGDDAFASGDRGVRGRQSIAKVARHNRGVNEMVVEVGKWKVSER